MLFDWDTAVTGYRGILKASVPLGGRVLRDAVTNEWPLQDRDAHLDAAIAWLKRAQAATEDDGVSYGYSIKGGWRPSYRETSGYIAVTFFDLEARGDREAGDLARKVSRWLCDIQEPDGSIANPQYKANEGIVFDTGQVLFGYVRAYRETKEDRYLEAARRAAAWLVDRVDADGAWRRNTHLSTPHTYNSRVAWAMLELDHAVPDAAVQAAARKNLDWALAQEKNGYFENCAFEPGVAPFTHTIAYAIRGFWEAGAILDEPRYRDVATRTADSVALHVRDDGWVPGQIDEQGRAAAKYCCLTGNCQLAIVWLKLFKETGSTRYLDAARRSLEYVMRRQDLKTSDLAMHGAVKGSHPIWGSYAPLSYPNWATKFLIDALLLLKEAET